MALKNAHHWRSFSWKSELEIRLIDSSWGLVYLCYQRAISSHEQPYILQVIRKA